MLVDDLGYADAFALFSAIGILVAILSPLYPRHIEQRMDDEESDDQSGLQAAYDHQLQNAGGEPLRSSTDEP